MENKVVKVNVLLKAKEGLDNIDKMLKELEEKLKEESDEQNNRTEN